MEDLHLNKSSVQELTPRGDDKKVEENHITQVGGEILTDSIEGEDHRNLSRELRSLYYKAAKTGLRATDEQSWHAEGQNHTVEEENIINAVNEGADIINKETPLDPEYNSSESGKFAVWHSKKPVHAMGSKITLSETIAQADDPEDDFFCGAILEIENASSETKLRLNDLLPYGYKLRPNISKEALSTYGGSTTITDKDIAFYIETRIVTYENLVSNTGFIGLLHEISHAWQNEFHPEAGQNTLKIKRIIFNADTLKQYQEELEKLRSDPDTYEPSEVMGITLTEARIPKDFEHVQMFLTRCIKFIGEQLNEDGVKTQDGKVVEITDPTFSDAINDYVWTERQAWASALRVFQKLRNANMLPESDTSTAISLVHKYLGTYQEGAQILGVKLEKNLTSQKPNA